MRFFNRRKKRSPESYYDYYEDHGVVPNTIEYYLEFGEEVEAEDIYWNVPRNATFQSREDKEEGDDGSTTVSFVPGKIPVLAIVDATTNISITSTLFPWNQSNATDVTKTTIGHSSSSRRTSSKYTDNTRSSSEDDTSSSDDEETAVDDFVEPGFLEATLSEYEEKALKHQDSMRGKSFCAISTVGFKSAAASAVAAQEFAKQYIRYNKSRDVEASPEGQEQGEVEVEAQMSREIMQNDTFSSLHSKSVISAPQKRERNGDGIMYSRIILHADKAGETTIKMKREPCISPPKIHIGQSKSTIKKSTAGYIGSQVVAPAFASIPSVVAKMHTVTKARAMPSLLDDDLASLRNSNTAKSSSITKKSKPTKDEQDTAVEPISSEASKMQTVMNTDSGGMTSLLDGSVSSLRDTNIAKSSSITTKSKPNIDEQVEPISSEAAKMQTVMNTDSGGISSLLDGFVSSLRDINIAKSSSITKKSKPRMDEQDPAVEPISSEAAKMQTVMNTDSGGISSLLDGFVSSLRDINIAKSSSITKKSKPRMDEQDPAVEPISSEAAKMQTVMNTNSGGISSLLDDFVSSLRNSKIAKNSINTKKSKPTKEEQDTAVEPISSEAAKMQTVMNTDSGGIPSLLDDFVSSLRNSKIAKDSIITKKSKLRKDRGLIRKHDWFRRKLTDSARRAQLDSSWTISTTRIRHQVGRIADEESADNQNTDLAPSIAPAISISDGPKTSPFPAPLAVLYDDKRNELAWLRCAPRRRNFEFPLLHAAAVMTPHVDGSHIKPASETTTGFKTKNEVSDSRGSNDVTLVVGLRETSSTREQSNPQTRDYSVEERDPPPPDNAGVSIVTAANTNIH
ncbi:hypothetical protein IV203_011342 [Nitzschia inconspicua]|uniref:Uncharacterized protein n=1 Tax=Nitzschia inconspicua TaxID=303405 RepID=A0A9K3PIS4_9STRA|nr:hypothetical protein IV203_011342 [Nitzschia inconspicua]